MVSSIIIPQSAEVAYLLVKFKGKANLILIWSKVGAKVIFKTATVQVEHQGVNE